MPVKRARGRPKKSEALSEANEDDITCLVNSAVNEVAHVSTGKSKPKNGMNSPNQVSEVDDAENLEITLEEVNESDATPKKRKVYMLKKRKVYMSKKYHEKIKATKLANNVYEGKKARIIRSLKDLSSAKEKIVRLYGSNEDKLLELAKIKEGFETSLFDFPTKIIAEDSRFYLKTIPLCNEGDVDVYDKLVHTDNKTQYSSLAKKDFDLIFKVRSEEVPVRIANTEININVSDKFEFPLLPYGKRSGFVYNTGAMITDMAWLNQERQGHNHYLAISLSQYSNKPLESRLRMFEKEEHTSCIDIYILDSETLTFSKIQTIAHNFGETWNLKWHEGCHSNLNNLGLLGFVCQDGTIKFIEIEIGNNERRGEASIKKCESPSICVSIPATLVTCFDFLSPFRIICGFKNGYVSEFDITDPNIPSYYEKMHESYVLSISVAYSKFENVVVSTLSVDGYFYVFDPNNIFTTRTCFTRFRGTNIIPISYVPQLYSYIYSDGNNCVKAVTPRACFSHPVSSLETTVTALGSSRLHPLTLTSCSDGSIIIDNVTRRMLTGVKNGTTTHKSLRLWKWDYDSEGNVFRLDHSYQNISLTVNDVCKLRVDAHGIGITSVKWNECRNAGKIYAFSNAAGLLTIENLGE